MGRIAGALVTAVVSFLAGCGGSDLGPLFQHSADIGKVARAGSVDYDPATEILQQQLAGETYRLTGSGANIWGTEDAFHFTWSPVAGDLRATARVTFTEEEGDPHRKAGWMFRESQASDAAYVDAAVHADGLIALQYRRERGGPTEEVRAVWMSYPRRRGTDWSRARWRHSISGPGNEPLFIELSNISRPPTGRVTVGTFSSTSPAGSFGFR